MASSLASPPLPPTSPLSPQDGGEGHLRHNHYYHHSHHHHHHSSRKSRKRKLDRNSSSPSRPSLSSFLKDDKTSSSSSGPSSSSPISNLVISKNSIQRHSTTTTTTLIQDNQIGPLNFHSLTNEGGQRPLTSSSPAFTSTSSSSDQNQINNENNKRRLKPRHHLRRHHRIISKRRNSSTKLLSTLSIHFNWDTHLLDIGLAIEDLYHSHSFSDVTLICTHTIDKVKGQSIPMIFPAHQLILASGSDYFRRILQESTLKHPLILLDGFKIWEIQSLLRFMYTGEVWLEDLGQSEMLVRAAQSLEIRGISECLDDGRPYEMRKDDEKPLDLIKGSSNELDFNEEVLKGSSSFNDDHQSHSPQLLNLSLNHHHHHHHHQHQHHSDDEWTKIKTYSSSSSPPPPPRGYEGLRVSRNGPQTTTTTTQSGFSIQQLYHHLPQKQQHPLPPPPTTTSLDTSIVILGGSHSSFPRRKQARPRRRSGDFIAQDLRQTDKVDELLTFNKGNDIQLSSTNRNKSNGNGHESQHSEVKKQPEAKDENKIILINQFPKDWGHAFGISHQLPKIKTGKAEIESEDVEFPFPEHRMSPSGSEKLPKGEIPGRVFPPSPLVKESSKSSPGPHPFPGLNGHLHRLNSDSESNNTESPPTPSPPSLFPVFPLVTNLGKKGDAGSGPPPPPWPGLPALASAPIFGRHRAQHSAPRGGPPRAWSNADLTEALHNVWNKKMTTSQASRIFGIPYNSLLMYVRGKYGKSLKLDLLKKGLDMAMMEKNLAIGGGKIPKSKSPRGGRRSASPATSNSSNNATPPHNNNNTITGKDGSGSPGQSSSGLNLNRILGSGIIGLGGTMSPEPHPPGLRLNRPSHHHPQSPDGLPVGLGDILPAFNPFLSSVFGDYPPPPPFPFPGSSGDNGGLSGILPLTRSHHPPFPSQPQRKHNLGSNNSSPSK